MADTVSCSSAEGIFRASFDKSTACNWGQDARHDDAERQFLLIYNYGANIGASMY